ncbi:MAG: HAD-IC family P-type ATPase, partial [Firmicutes bacterium]|nr:HAD-IC family P-type ATPase [Bacillota bacterium]
DLAVALGIDRERVTVWQTEVGPYLFVDAGRSGPTVGFYWHLDVQPVGEGQEHLWDLVGPEGREASRGQPALWGRGSCDDLGLGLAAWIGIKTALPHCPYNLQFLISTGEESGDRPLGDLIAANQDRLTAEVWFIPDSSRQNGRPALNLSLRGLARFHLEVRGPTVPMHSGVVGGACPDPALAAFQILGALVDRHQRLDAPVLAEVPYDIELERAFAEASPDREEFLATAGVSATTGGPGALGVTLWRRPSLTIHAVETDVPPYLNAVASVCRVYFSIRLVPGQKPERVAEALQARVASCSIPGIRARVAHRPGDLVEGTRVPKVEPWVSRCQAAMEASYGRPVVFNGSGGTEPVVGLLALADRPRAEAAAGIAALHRLGVTTVMLTGDHARTAHAIARELGIDRVYAALSPAEKVAHIRRLEETLGPVAMVGDGINDAPALAAATVGIAMGAAGTDAAIEAADVALMADDLMKVAEAIRLGRMVRAISLQNLVFSLLILGVLIPAALLGAITVVAAVVVHEVSELLAVANGLRAARPRPA